MYYLEVLFFVEVVFFAVVVFLLPEPEEVVFFAAAVEVVFLAVEDDEVFFAVEEEVVFLPEEEVLAEDEEVVFLAEEEEEVFLAEEDDEVFFPVEEDEVFFLAFGFLMTVVPLGLAELPEEELLLVSVLVRLSRPPKRSPRPPEELLPEEDEEEDPPPKSPPSRLPRPPEEEPPPSRPPSRLPRPPEEDPPLLVPVLVRPRRPWSRGRAAVMILMTLLRSTPVFCATSRVCSSLGLPSAIRGSAAESTFLTSFCVAPLSLLISFTLPPERRSVRREDISINGTPFGIRFSSLCAAGGNSSRILTYSLKKTAECSISNSAIPISSRLE